MLGSRRQTNGRSGALQYAQNAKAWVRDYCTAIKWGRWHPFTPLERKAREATRNEAWGPTGTLLNELAEASSEIESCQIIFAVLELRLGYPSEKWRNVYKALQVLEFLTKRGSDHCIAFAKEDIQGSLANLKCFEYIGPDGRDYGVNVRIRADAVGKLLEDEDLLMRDRAQLKSKSKKTYQGFSRTEMEAHDGVGRANSWGGSMRNPSLRELNAPEIVETVEGSIPELKSRGAGEMKGISLEENKKNIAVLKEIMSRDRNKVCADCLGGSQPTWASINCGVFICMKCAGIHRGLGVHISKVRSCTLDTWLPGQVEFMDRTGNTVANSYWEANLPYGSKPSSGDPGLEAFIKRKYSKVYAKGSWPPEPQSGKITSEPGTCNSSAKTKPAGAFWSRIDNSETKVVNGFEDSVFGAENTAHRRMQVVTSGELLDSVFNEHDPSQPVLLPAPSHVSTESAVLFHAHTYPDFLSFESRVFPSAGIVSSQHPDPQEPSELNVPQQPTDKPLTLRRKQPMEASETQTRGRLRSRGDSSVIITNQLDLADLDDVESLCGFGRVVDDDDHDDHQHNHVPSFSGFEEDAEWPFDPDQKGKSQGETDPSSQTKCSSSPFNSAIDKPEPLIIKQRLNVSYGGHTSTKQGELSPQIQSVSSTMGAGKFASTTPSQGHEVAEKNPTDDLSSSYMFDFLSEPLAAVQRQQVILEDTQSKDPFCDLEPIVVEPLARREHPAAQATMPAGADKLQYDRMEQQVDTHPYSTMASEKMNYSSRHTISFIGEGGSSSRKNLLYSGRQGPSAIFQKASPSLSLPPDQRRMQTTGRLNIDASCGWNNPHSGVIDIDKILIQQIGRLEMSGSNARGVRSRVRPGAIQK